MSSPIIWIFLPGILSVFLLFFQQKKRVVLIIGTTIAILLAVLAWRIPIGSSINIARISLNIGDTLTIYGRRFILDGSDRSTLLLIYLGLAFWFIGSGAARSGNLFVPLGLAIAALLTAALAVEPFLFAALIIELVVLVSVPLLSAPGMPVGRGTLRYLILQTLGFPFILFTGWFLAGVDSSTVSTDFLVVAFVLMGMGFWLLLSIFPFHTWIPMIAAESHPYAVAFLLYELPLVISLFGLGFLDRYTWLRITPGLFTILEVGGVTMVVIGGVFAAFQSHLGRMLGYAVLIEIGLSLLAIRVGMDPAGSGKLLGAYFATLLPRALSFGIWALSLVIISSGIKNQPPGPVTAKNLSFNNVPGLARRFPIAALALLLAHFSLAGFPLLVGFPVRLAVLDELSRFSLISAAVVVLGYAGLMIGGIRTMSVLVIGTGEVANWQVNESRWERILLALGGVILILMGVFPQLFTPAFAGMADVFLRSTP